MKPKTLPNIRKQGLEILIKGLGPAGMIRFMHQYESGSGDYTKKRGGWIGNPSFDEIKENLKH